MAILMQGFYEGFVSDRGQERNVYMLGNVAKICIASCEQIWWCFKREFQEVV